MSIVIIKDSDNNVYNVEVDFIKGKVIVSWDGELIKIKAEDIEYIKLK